MELFINKERYSERIISFWSDIKLYLSEIYLSFRLIKDYLVYNDLVQDFYDFQVNKLNDDIIIEVARDVFFNFDIFFEKYDKKKILKEQSRTRTLKLNENIASKEIYFILFSIKYLFLLEFKFLESIYDYKECERYIRNLINSSKYRDLIREADYFATLVVSKYYKELITINKLRPEDIPDNAFENNIVYQIKNTFNISYLSKIQVYILIRLYINPHGFTQKEFLEWYSEVYNYSSEKCVDFSDSYSIFYRYFKQLKDKKILKAKKKDIKGFAIPFIYSLTKKTERALDLLFTDVNEHIRIISERIYNFLDSWGYNQEVELFIHFKEYPIWMIKKGIDSNLIDGKLEIKDHIFRHFQVKNRIPKKYLKLNLNFETGKVSTEEVLR